MPTAKRTDFRTTLPSPLRTVTPDLHFHHHNSETGRDLRLRRGGDHASLGRGTKISIAYGPQTNLEINLDPAVPRKTTLTSRFAVGAEDSNPRRPPCKSATAVPGCPAW